MKEPVKRTRKSKATASPFREGDVVKNRYTGLNYTIASVTDKTVYVIELSGGSIEMAQADIELV